jgi:hypothetical protein
VAGPAVLPRRNGALLRVPGTLKAVLGRLSILVPREREKLLVGIGDLDKRVAALDLVNTLTVDKGQTLREFWRIGISRAHEQFAVLGFFLFCCCTKQERHAQKIKKKLHIVL